MTMLSHFAASGGSVPVYIEDVFSAWAYTGNSSTQNIVNGIDLAGNGGLVGIFTRTSNSTTPNFSFWDSMRGVTNYLVTQSTSGQNVYGAVTTGVTSFNSNGFSLGSDAGPRVNRNENYISYTWRKQPKFFDEVTWVGDGTSSRNIPHNLGSVPGCIIVKKTTSPGDWTVYHRSIGNTSVQYLNAAVNASVDSTAWSNTTPTSTQFTIGNNGAVNQVGQTYVAYLFAHNAGGFGPNGTDSVISCGSFQGIGAPTINLGWEPQFLLIKPIDYCDTAGDWFVVDNIRGLRAVGTTFPRERFLSPNASYPESLDSGGTNPYGNCDSLNINATGFQAIGYPFNGAINGGYRNYIYIAIRRGPMKPPTSGTNVFAPVSYTANNPTTLTTGFPVDLTINTWRTTAGDSRWTVDRLRGGASLLRTSGVDAESNDGTTYYSLDSNTTLIDRNHGGSILTVAWNFRRAPGFFDEVCYLGNSTAGRALTHSLGVVPELMIVKNRSSGTGWSVYCGLLGNDGQLVLNENSTYSTAYSPWNYTNPTASVFTLNSGGSINSSGANYVAYLFASCPGVSKVGSYTGNGDAWGSTGAGVTQDINCGFTSGARFVLIKCTSTASNWYVWDTARGITSTTEPDISLNNTSAESSGFNSVNPLSSGFTVRQNAGTNVNAAGQTYIYLAIA